MHVCSNIACVFLVALSELRAQEFNVSTVVCEAFTVRELPLASQVQLALLWAVRGHVLQAYSVQYNQGGPAL